MQTERYVLEWLAREVKARRGVIVSWIESAKRVRDSMRRLIARDAKPIDIAARKVHMLEYVAKARRESQKVRVMIRYIRMIRADVLARGISDTA